MATQRTVLITGATGKQGGAVARHLKGKGFALRTLTRKPDGAPARALAAAGVQVLQGNFDDAASLKRALAGVWGVFSVQDTWEAGVEKEEEQGKRLAELAKEAGVEHFVYSSVASADRQTGIPHFENKFRVEGTVLGLAFPSHVILRPVFFMENLPSPWFLQGDKLISALKPDTKVQMIAVDDIGRFGALAFEQAKTLNGSAIDMAGDTATMIEAAQVLGDALGRRIVYEPIPIEAVRRNSADFASMLEWFDSTGYDVDIPALEEEYSLKLLRLRDWARQSVKPQATGAGAAAR